MLFICVLVLCTIRVDSAYEGDACKKDDVIGVCTDIRKCPTALQDIKNRKIPQICSFNYKTPVVCCNNKSNIGGNIHATTIRATSELPIDKVNGSAENAGCNPILPTLAALKNGRKAWDKCIEYQQLVFPCEKSPILSGGGDRADKCHHNAITHLIGTSDAAQYEFPHAILLGYGDDSSRLQWLCGGALISDRFILTAAHCTYSKECGPVTHAALHTLERADINPHFRYQIKKIINHPEYKYPKPYNDIALLELEKPIFLDSFTVPACLDTGDSEMEDAISTSSNMNDILGTHSNVLRKIHLSRFSKMECSKVYPAHRRGALNATSQICYGDRTQSKDICEDDGGSPLLVENRKISCMYSIIGITSYGRGCLSHNPGVYTRVEHYLPWIERVVWP